MTHLSFDELEGRLDGLHPPGDRGRVVLVVARHSDGSHNPLECATVTPDSGVSGDRWCLGDSPNHEAQITVMRADFAALIGNGQPLTVPGDNLLVDLDLSLANLPPGSRLRAGSALVEVTPHPHTGCAKFAARFGRDALRLTADPRFRERRLRGIHVRVIESGDIAPGDLIEVVERGDAPAPRR